VPPRRSRRRRFIWLTPILLLGGLAWFFQSEMASRLARKLIEQAAEAAIGEDITIGNLKLDYWPPKLTLEGVVIAHRASGETIGVVRSIEVSGAVQNWNPVLKRVQLDNPVVVLHLEQGKLREFQSVRQSETPAERFPWQELVINQGTFRLITPEGTLELDQLQLGPDGERLDLVLGRLGLDGGDIHEETRDLVIEDILFTPQELEIPLFDFDLGPLSLEGSVAKRPSGELGGMLSVQSTVPVLAESFHRTVPLNGAIALDLELAGTIEKPDLRGILLVTGLERIPKEAGYFGDVRASAYLDLPDQEHPGLVIEQVSWPWAGGRVAAEGRLDLIDRSVSVTARGEALDLGQVLSNIGLSQDPWVRFTGDAEVTLSGPLSPFELRGPFELALMDLKVATGPVNSNKSTRMLEIPKIWGYGNVVVKDQHLIFEGTRAVSQGSTGSFLADIGIMGNQNLKITVDFPSFDLGLLKPLGGAGLAGRGRLSGRLEGSYSKLHAHAELVGIKNARVLDFAIADSVNLRLDSPDLKELNFTGIEAVLGESKWNGAISLRFPDEGLWLSTDLKIPQGTIKDFSGIFLDMGNLDGKLYGKLALSGDLYHLTGSGDFHFTDINLYGELFPSGMAYVFMDDGIFTLEKMLLTRNKESLLARGTIGRGWASDIGLIWDNAPLTMLDHFPPLSVPVEGKLKLWASVGGTLFEPEPAGSLFLTDLSWNKQPQANSRLDFHTTAGVLSYQGTLMGTAVAVQGSLGLWNDQPYQLSATLSQFPLDLFYPPAADGKPIDGGVSGKVSLNGHFGDTPSPARLIADLDDVWLSWDGRRLSNGSTPWHLDLTGKDVEEISLHIEESARKNEGSGSYTSFDMSGSAHPGRVDLSGEGFLDLSLTRALIPGLTEAVGIAPIHFELHHIKGQPSDIKATLKMKQALIVTEYFPAPFENVRAEITATPTQWDITGFFAEVGGGTLSSRRSVIYTENWWPSRYALAGTVRGSRVQYLDFLPPMLVDGELAFDGPNDALLLSGELRILDMQFRERIDWEGMVLSLQEDYLTETAPIPRTSWFGMDLVVSANNTIHLRNNVADAEASVALRVIGDTARPGLLGDIRIEPGGRVYLQEREFEVVRAEAHYIEPYRFDPDLDIELTTELASSDEDYQIRYMINGPFSGWTTSASSEPALSQADINALLLFGVTREEMEQGGYGNIGTALAVETGGLLSASIASNSATVLIDRLLNRWTLVSGVTERGSKTVSNEPRLVAESSEIAGFTFTGELSMGADWYVSVERRIANRLYAATYATSDQAGRSMPVAAFGAEFKLRWEAD
jgi:hypothetical protein